MTRTVLHTAGRWAARTDFGEESHALTEAIAARRQSGGRVLDLTVSNPTRCGFDYDASAILQPLASLESLHYDADPLGMRTARESISRLYYAPRGVTVPPDRLLLTTSTSEAYGYLLRLLCDPGDQILVPSPSYPLFDLLARMHDVELVPYPLPLHDDWRIDPIEMERRITPRTRAIVVVHPNNPTGHLASAGDRKHLQRLALHHNLALIVDEVFLDYPIESPGTPASFAAADPPVLTFVLSGLSKVLALPQMKLAWTVVCGPDPQCRAALQRLEFIADTFLSLQSPVQHALKSWLPLADAIQIQVRARLRTNLATLDAALLGSALVRRARVEAGWSVLVRVPAWEPDDQLALRLLEQAGVVTHPGSFYGLGARGWLVLSLLTPLAIFAEGVAQLISAVEASANTESSAATSVKHIASRT